MKKLLLAGLGLVVMLAVLAPWINGRIAEQVYHQALVELNERDGGLRLESHGYERGYRSARDVVRLTLPVSPTIPAVAPLTVELETDIRHGLFGVRASTRVQPESVAGWSAMFPQDEPRLEARASLIRRVRAHFSVPAFSWRHNATNEPATGQMEALAARVDWRPDRHIRFSLDWPGGSWRDPQGHFAMQDVKVRQHGVPFQDYLWTGESIIEFEQLSLKVRDEPERVVQGGKLVSWSEARRDYLDASLRLNVAELREGETSFGEQAFRMDIRGFHAPSVDAILGSFHDLVREQGNRSEAEQAQVHMEAFVKLSDALQQLSVHGGELDIALHALETPTGSLEGHLRMVYPRLPKGERGRPVSLLQHAEGDVLLRFDPQLLAQLPDQLKPVAAYLRDEGLIQKKEGEWVLEMALRDMALHYNGEVFPLPPLL